MGIQSGPDGGPADPQPSQPFCRTCDPLGIALDSLGIGAELLPKAHRHSVLQMRPTGFHDVIEFLQP